MVNFILTILAIGLTAAVLFVTVSYVNPNQAISRAVATQTETAFLTLEQALLDHHTVAGSWLVPDAAWVTTLTPTYAFLPRPAVNMEWTYALGGAGRYVCMRPAGGGSGALVAEAQYVGFTRFLTKASAQQAFVSTAGCGVTTNSAAPTTWPAAVSVTYWITPY